MPGKDIRYVVEFRCKESTPDTVRPAVEAQKMVSSPTWLSPCPISSLPSQRVRTYRKSSQHWWQSGPCSSSTRGDPRQTTCRRPMASANGGYRNFVKRPSGLVRDWPISTYLLPRLPADNGAWCAAITAGMTSNLREEGPVIDDSWVDNGDFSIDLSWWSCVTDATVANLPLSAVQQLDLYGADFTGEGLRLDMPILQRLRLGQTKITDKGLGNLNMPVIQELELSWTRLPVSDF